MTKATGAKFTRRSSRQSIKKEVSTTRQGKRTEKRLAGKKGDRRIQKVKEGWW